MLANVYCVGKEEFKRKDGKTGYVLHIVEENNGIFRVHRAFTSKKHYDVIEIEKEFKTGYRGYLNFDNGFTHFYLPKEDVELFEMIGK